MNASCKIFFTFASSTKTTQQKPIPTRIYNTNMSRVLDVDLIASSSEKNQNSSVITTQISTRYGNLSVSYDQSHHEDAQIGRRKPLITYHDCGTNHRTCFSSFFSCAGKTHEINTKFCAYHVDAPGMQDGSVEGVPEEFEGEVTLDKLAQQLEDVSDFFGWTRGKANNANREVFAIGVGSGATVISIYASRFANPIAGMILVSPMSRQANYAEWMYAKWFRVKCARGSKRVSDSGANHLMGRLFSKYGTDGFAGKFSSDLALTTKNEMQEMRIDALLAYYDATVNRLDNTHIASSLKCRTLILAGSESPWYNDSLNMNRVMDKTLTSWVDMEKVGAAVTMEHPSAMLSPVHLWLQRLKAEGYL